MLPLVAPLLKKAPARMEIWPANRRSRRCGCRGRVSAGAGVRRGMGSVARALVARRGVAANEGRSISCISGRCHTNMVR